MDNILLTIAKTAQAEFVEKKSRFIGYIAPCNSEAEATEFISTIKKKHNDATHNVYAYQIGRDNEFQRSTDDGEPAGTAGRPILEIIKRSELHNTVIVVTRYFGGTLLGTGGLVRAYSQAALLAIEAAGMVKLLPATAYTMHFSYNYLPVIQKLLEELHAPVDQISYGEDILLTCRVPHEIEQTFNNKIQAIGNGSIRLLVTDDEALCQYDISL